MSSFHRVAASVPKTALQSKDRVGRWPKGQPTIVTRPEGLASAGEGAVPLETARHLWSCQPAKALEVAPFRGPTTRLRRGQSRLEWLLASTPQWWGVRAQYAPVPFVCTPDGVEDLVRLRRGCTGRTVPGHVACHGFPGRPRPRLYDEALARSFSNSSSVSTRIPSDLAFSSLLPGSAPASTKSVFLETLEVARPPWRAIRASISERE